MAEGSVEEIRQRIILEGADGALKELEKLGDEGAAAIEKLKAAGDGDFAKGVRAAVPEVAAMQDALAVAEAKARGLPTALNKSTVAAKKFGAASADVATVTTEVAAVDAAAVSTGVSLRELSRILRGVSRASGIRELGQVSRVLRGLGQASAFVGPAIALGIVAGLDAIALSAAHATQVVQDAAFAMGQTPQVFQAVAQAAIAVGGSVEKFGAAIGKQPALIKATADSEKALSAAQANVQTTMEKNEDAAIKLSDSLVGLRKQQRTLANDFNSGADGAAAFATKQADIFEQFRANKITADQYHKSVDSLAAAQQAASIAQTEAQAALAKQVRDANAAIVDQDIAARAADKAAREAVRTQQENATALEKLNIGAAQFKALNLQDRVKLLAERLILMEPGIKRNSIALEVLGEDARKFIVALDSAGGSMTKFIAESAKLSPVFTAAENAVGDRFTTAIEKLGAVLVGLKNQFGIAVAPAFLKFFDSALDAFVRLMPIVKQFGTTLGTFLTPLLTALGEAMGAVVLVIELMSAAFNGLAKLINSVFGTNLTGAQLFLGVMIGLAAALAPVATGLVLIITTIGLLISVLKEVDFSVVAVNFAAFVTGLQTAAANLWKSIVGIFNTGVAAISGMFDSTFQFIIGIWESFKSYVIGWVSAITGFLQPLIDRINKIAAFFASSPRDGGGGDAGPGFASGGRVRGPGSGTSDSILAWLSNGEFVMRMKAVQKYGLGFMSAINQGKLDLDALAGFSLGGVVQHMLTPGQPSGIPRFAAGGPVIPGQGLKPVSINFEGQKFNAMMTDDALSALSKKSVMHRAQRAGRRPTYFGG